MSKKQQLAKRIEGIDKNVWVEFVGLALEYKPVNLGQGFPDFAAPPHVVDALAKTVTSSDPMMHQYTRGYGHPRLVKALATMYGGLINREINPNTEVLCTVGAYDALFCTFMGLINPGDEVIIVEPYFDCYAPMTRLAGGVPVFIPVRPNQSKVDSTKDFVLDPDELASKFTDKTKAIIFNTPNNPLGKVFHRKELEMIAKLCIEHDVICISDEVYEWLVYDGIEHIRIASLPGMWDRTITVGSAGKTFSVTGWKEAAAIAFETEIARLDKPDSYFKELQSMLFEKRERMAKLLTDAGLIPIIPEGGYFMMADATDFARDIDLNDPELGDGQRDYKLVRYLTKKKGIGAIPPSAFYNPENKHLGANYIRFCFIKEESTLDKAEKIIKEMMSVKKN
ncbi:kynurenine aminotransferase-like [Saccoglossus kowalevskii]|uniref:kynurenine--oxoglutarate transaminase n=1 Tax=Saccoglossus kowalevskii TaxID=10224 RepID=A0ABM0MW83_SACKO|nr:PREDICTED: kynurenine--oxoglutarate transaminase 3-like [Saccoglossus kowalevskii]